MVEVHLGLYNPEPQVPSRSWSASRRAPHPSVATRARSAATVGAAASTRSRSTCQRIAGSPASSQVTGSAPASRGVVCTAMPAGSHCLPVANNRAPPLTARAQWRELCKLCLQPGDQRLRLRFGTDGVVVDVTRLLG